MKRGLLIGRFQPFHKGHESAVEYALKKCDELIIIIGSPKDYGTDQNPFTLKEREEMIRLGLKEELKEKIIIKAVNDYENGAKWVREIEKNSFGVVFSNNPDVHQALRKHEVKSIPVTINCSGTEVRRKMYLGQNWKECVSPPVAEYLTRIRAVKRIKEILK